MPPKKKKPEAALAALAARRAGKNSEASGKHELEPESEDDSHPPMSGKRQRSGTFSKAKALSLENVSHPGIPKLVPDAATRPGLRPRPRPVPQAQPDGPIPNSTQSAILTLAQEPGVRIIIMPSMEGPNGDAPGGSEGRIPSPDGVLELDVKPKVEGELTTGARKPVDDNASPATSSGTIAEKNPLANDGEHAYDSDVMIIEEVGRQGSDPGDCFWSSEGENASETITYKLPPKVVQQAATAWGGVEYESHDELEADDFMTWVKPEPQTNVQTPRVKSEHKAEPVSTSKLTGPGAPKKVTKPQSTRAQPKAKVESSDNDGDDGEDDPGDEVKSDEDDSCVEYEDGVKLPDGVVMLHYEVPRFKGIRIMKLRSDSSYRKFCRSTADILDCSINDLNIGYSAGKPKELKGKLLPRVIENKEDYEEMVTNAVKSITAERTRYRKEKESITTAAEKAKRKTGAPSKKKPAPIQPYVVKLAMLDEDDPKGKKKSAKKKVGKSKGTSDSEGHRDGDESLASRQLGWFERLQAKHFCATHQRVCAVIPGRPNEAGTHVKLERSSLLLWAEMLAKNNPEASIHCPPKALNLQSRVAEEKKVAVAAPGSEAKPSIPQEALAPLQVAQMMMPWLYGHPGAFYPPFPGSGVNGYPGHQMPQFPGVVAPAPPPAVAPAVPLNDPLLSDWLNHCDSGPRGADKHDFASYLPAFSANMIIRLSDIARLDSAKQLIESVGDYHPKMPFGTANRLIQYAKADYR